MIGKEKPKKKFEYHRPDPAAMKRQATQSSGMYDQMFKTGTNIFSPQKGQSYCIRIMPGTWENVEHFGYMVMIHNQVGADNQRYLCLKHHKDEECPLCDEAAELKRTGEGEAAYEIQARRNYGYWVIDRDKETEGPLLWRVGWQVDRNLAGLCVDRRTNATTFIDNPDNGYDIEFDCVPKKKWSEVINIRIARKSTTLSDNEKRQDKWLAYIQENPIPDMLNFFDAEHIAKVLSGKKVKAEDEEEDEDRPKTRADRSRRDRDEEDDEKPRRKSLRDEEEENEEPAPRKKRREIGVDDELDEEPSSKRRRADPEDEDDEDPPPRKKRPVAEDDEEDAPPPKRRRMEEEDDEEPTPRKKRPPVDEDDEE